jgi:hypothetical protein
MGSITAGNRSAGDLNAAEPDSPACTQSVALAVAWPRRRLIGTAADRPGEGRPCGPPRDSDEARSAAAIDWAIAEARRAPRAPRRRPTSAGRGEITRSCPAVIGRLAEAMAVSAKVFQRRRFATHHQGPVHARRRPRSSRHRRGLRRPSCERRAPRSGEAATRAPGVPRPAHASRLPDPRATETVAMVGATIPRSHCRRCPTGATLESV